MAGAMDAIAVPHQNVAGIEGWSNCKITSGVLEFFSESALFDLDHHLYRSLSNILFPVLYERFYAFVQCEYCSIDPLYYQTSDSELHDGAYSAFLDELRMLGLKEIFIEFPVLARQIVLVVDSWVKNTALLISRFSKDHEALKEIPAFRALSGRLTVQKIEYSISDPHNGGQSAAVLSLSCDKSIVYKPRNHGVDAFWRDLLYWCEAKGVKLLPQMPWFVARDNYGWDEFIRYDSADSSEKESVFFERAGALLALLFITKSTDFHLENIIVSNNFPVPVDLEGIAHPLPAVTGGAPSSQGSVS
jgi:lantibiotic modifying enzyme